MADRRTRRRSGRRPAKNRKTTCSGTCSRQVEPRGARFPCGQSNNPPIDKTDAGGLHSFANPNHPLGRNCIGIHKESLKTRSQNVIGHSFRGMRRANVSGVGSIRHREPPAYAGLEVRISRHVRASPDCGPAMPNKPDFRHSAPRRQRIYPSRRDKEYRWRS